MLTFDVYLRGWNRTSDLIAPNDVGYQTTLHGSKETGSGNRTRRRPSKGVKSPPA